MKILKKGSNLVLTLLLVTMIGCDYVDKVAEESRRSMQYEKVALELAHKNRKLKTELRELRYEMESLKAKSNYLSIKLEEKKEQRQERALASLKKDFAKDDLVKFEVYNWTPEQILSVAQKEFEKKNFEKSAQFFHSYGNNYPTHKSRNDLYLFQAGVAAYESGKHNEWVELYLGELVKNHPTSAYYRSAKLWLGLSYLKAKRHKDFFKVVEEFRMKYRNTDEWKILSTHYEKIVQKFKH